MTNAAPTLTELAEAFGLVELHAESLTRFARVHRGRTTDGREVVLKVAGSRSDRVNAMARWQRDLATSGVPVVAALDLAVPNPQQVGEDWWVVYPFLDGAAYHGAPEQIESAGELLGRIHAAGAATEGLRDYEWPDTSHEEVLADLETLEGVLSAQNDPEAFAAVRDLGRRWWEHKDALESRDADLPRCGGSSDYKANNLIWTGATPTLVDPDNGGHEPRLFELALVAALFHNECDGAPARLLTRQEWSRFLTGYTRHVELTAAELELWPLVLDHILWEEGTWVLEDNDEAAWADPRQRGYLLGLARANVDRFPLLPSATPAVMTGAPEANSGS
ncbi:phosphotransferase enzyme family protein [Ornithinimicrobium murale]|uniref:phosphotransferase enzyme family protein n=1 Tax=Ornithinimicrobium murale TaxID=1050153 RepID=UPI0013B44E60|nr:phosphotransferase [Ornithinimicrobium murale]